MDREKRGNRISGIPKENEVEIMKEQMRDRERQTEKYGERGKEGQREM